MLRFRLTIFLTYSIFGLLGCHAFNCTIPNVGPGYCIPLNKCESHYSEWLKNGRGPYSLILLDPIKRVCGYENGMPQVCCKPPKDLSFDKHPKAKLLPKLDECIVDMNDRIVNGKKAYLGQFPWMSLIHYKRRGYKVSDSYARSFFMCGGSIINSRYILTAAHCFRHPTLRANFVRVGEHNFLTNPDCEKVLPGKEICAPKHQDIKIEKIMIHPNYTKKPFNFNDIALIRLKTPIKFDSDYVRSICLPLTNELQFNLNNEIVTLAGWGLTENLELSDVLQFIDRKPVDLEKCSLAYENTSIITSKQICIESKKADTCAGDSGGPLFSNHFIEDDYVTVLHGVVSYGPLACGDGDLPSINTNVADYLEWILNQLRP